MKHLAPLSVGASLTAGCLNGPPLAETQLSRGETAIVSFASQDRERLTLVHRPAKRVARPPLLVVLHGGGGSGHGMEEVTGFSQIADREGFVLAYPYGLGGPHGFGRAWNDGRCCGAATFLGIDDRVTVSDLVAALEKKLTTDPRRRYLVGYSNGGALAFALAQHSSDAFAAVGVYAASMTASGSLDAPSIRGPRPNRTLSLMTVMSVADPRIPYRGDEGRHATALSQQQIHRYWAGQARCPRRAQRLASVDPAVARYGYENCPDGVSIEHQRLYGWNHEWPGPSNLHACRTPDEPLYRYDVAEQFWRFFADKRR